MAKKTARTYSRYTKEAIRLIGAHVKVTRLERGISAQELSERAGISRGLLHRIEKGDPSCGVGVVFEVAVLLGLKFFHSDYDDLALKNKTLEKQIALLPSRIKQTRLEIDDDF